MSKETAHFGDPCVHCGQAHDDVAPGPCPGRPLIHVVDRSADRDKADRLVKMTVFIFPGSDGNG